MKKRWISVLLMLVMLVSLLPAVSLEADALYENYLNRSQVDGSYYTTSAKMASKLNSIFDGYANIYHDSGCTNQVNVCIGTSNVKNNGVTMYAGPYGGRYKSAGTSCWIYAAGVYYTLFGEVGFQTPGPNSEALDLSVTSSRITSYENFKAWGVRDGVGAHIRTTNHSMIVLDYDEDTLTVVDGNNDGAGTVSVRKWSWDRINKTVNYITQPTDAYYRSEYPVYDCDHNYEWAITKSATCVDDGVITYTCNKCSDSYTERISPAGHDFKNDICVVCGAADTSVLKGTCGANLSWTLRTGTLTVTGSGAMYDYGYGGAPWFKNRTSIKSVVIDDKVTSVGDYAFAYSDKLGKVEIGDGVKRIGDFAFQACAGITALTLGNAVQTIGLEAFKYSAITSLTIPDSTTYIGDLAFGFCEALGQLRLGKKVTTIRDYAFYNTPSLKKITFTGSAPAIGVEAFLNAKATAHYPTNDPTWNENAMQDYGGDLTWKSYYQGLNQVNGVWGYYKEGVLQKNYTGLVPHTNGCWYYVKDGTISWNYTGLVKHSDGKWCYVQKGAVNWNYTGLVKHTNGSWYYVEKSVINWSYNGLAKHTNGSWYYIENGAIKWSYTGLAKHTNGSWYYIKKGEVDWKYTGLVQHTNGSWYYVKNGVISWSYTGLVQHTNGAWYYVEKGTINWKYAGLVTHTNGSWYYVEKGSINWSYTGLGQHSNGKWCYVRKGAVDWNYTGLVQHSNGSWYYVEKGAINWNYTGLVQHSNGGWFYVEKGTIKWSYTGLVKHSDGRLYYVKKGMIGWTFTGLAQDRNGTWYYAQKGAVNGTYTGLVQHTNGVWYCIRNGKLDWGYTGLMKHTDGVLYYIEKGQINWSYSGAVQHNGQTYNVVKGRVR